MRIIVDIGHPGHVHFFKNFIWEMQKRKHKVLITSSDKDVAIDLLKSYGFDFIFTSKRYSGVKLGYELLKRDLQMAKIAKKFKPDIITGINNTIAAHVSKVTRAKSIIFTDTEHAKLANMITFPFSDVICTPSCYRGHIGEKQFCYEGYHELAYLHPRYFTPNPDILQELGFTTDDRIIIMRFVSWEATHDLGHHGLTLEDKRKAVHEFEKYGHVLISSEKPLPADLEKYKISISPEKMHDLLYYATLLYGESATMASECAVLGTHAIFCDYAGRGYTDEEELKYDLVYNFKDERTMAVSSLNKAIELLENPNLKINGKKKREVLLKDKIDVTSFMTRFVEQYR